MSEDLSDAERRRYAWQIDLPGFGEAGQRRLKAATALVTRAGGLGGIAALELAAAGIGRLRIAHAGIVHEADLNRQVLQRPDRIGLARGDAILSTLRAFNPDCAVEVVDENTSAANAARLLESVDVAVDAAPLFEERFALNDACVRAGVPMVEAAVHHLEAAVTTVVPGRGPCLRCWCPEAPATWTRRFPVLGAVSGTAGCIAASEAVKLITGIGTPLIGRMLLLDLGTGDTRLRNVRRDPACAACAGLAGSRASS
jgi:molybdopterin/thiamine biosynthesis adenylyltransferase